VPSDPFGAHGPLAPVVVVVETGRVVVVIDVEVELVVVDGLVDVVGAAGIVLVVVVVGAVPPRPGAAHAARQRAPVVTDASNSDPRPMSPYRQVA